MSARDEDDGLIDVKPKRTMVPLERALAAEARVAELEREKAWGYLDALGHPHKGCPPVGAEPFTVLFVRAEA